jgi:hypothetical protein
MINMFIINRANNEKLQITNRIDTKNVGMIAIKLNKITTLSKIKQNEEL